MTSYSCSATPISYKGDEILRLACFIFEIWCGTDRQRQMWQPLHKALTLTVCEPNNLMSR